MKIILFVGFVAAASSFSAHAQIVKPSHRTFGRNDTALVEKFQIENTGLLTDDYLRSDSFAIGILRANKWNTEVASKYLKKLLLWRVSNKVAKLAETDVDPDLLELFPYRLTEVSKNGCPFLEIDGGNWLIVDFMLSHEFVRDATKMFSRFTTQIWEKTRYALNNLSPRCDQAVLVVNAKGVTSAKVYAEPNAINGIVAMSATLENYYPHLFKNIMLINANQDFLSLMDILLPSIGQLSNEIQTFSENEEDKVAEIINQYLDPEQRIFY